MTTTYRNALTPEDQTKRQQLLQDLLQTCAASGLEADAIVNSLFVAAANIIVPINEERRDYIPVRAFRAVIESVRKQFKNAQEK
jgi:hypothetical protein